MSLGLRRPDRIRDLRNDESGAVIVWVTVVIFVLFGMVGLAIDGSRYMYLNSNMKQVADAAALAAAKELDGAKDAITRARNAATQTTFSGYVDNHPETAWASDAQPTVEIASVSVCSALNSRGSDCVATTDPKKAVYVRVVTKARQLEKSFISAVMGGGAAQAAAEATAASSFSICGNLQSFMCNPWEDTVNPGRGKNWTGNVPKGTMVLLADGTGSASGNWGLLDAGNPAKKTFPPFWAANAPASCTVGNVADTYMDTDPGNNAQFAAPGMNVRFDSPIGVGDESLSAPIVIDGLKSNGKSGYSCANTDSATPSEKIGSTTYTFAQPTSATDVRYKDYCSNTTKGSCPFPRDRSITSVTRAGAGKDWKNILMGSGPHPDDLDAYWLNHHGSVRPTGINTRWGLYNYELDNSVTWRTDSIEPHAPVCTNSTVGDRYRRVINVAIVDCNYWDVQGRSDFPMATLIAKFFMTEQAVTTGPPAQQGRIYGELIDTYDVNASGGVIYQNVQLVR